MALINKKINSLLDEKKISVRGLAEKIGMSNPGLYKALEKNDFKVSQLQKIADVLEVDICEFFSDSGAGKFEDELKYFISSYDPPKFVRKIDPEGNILLQENRFLNDSLYNIYNQYIIHKPIERLNIKKNSDIYINKIYIHADGFLISLYKNGEYFDKDVKGSPLLSKVLLNIYGDISKEDIKIVSDDIVQSINKFNSFISESKFIAWFTDNFKAGDDEIRKILMKISRDFPIILDKQ